MEEKLKHTIQLIKCWYEAWGGDVYVSFSGGKDSTVLLHIVRSMFPDVPAVFCNTGLEYPEIVNFVKDQENVTILRPAKNFKQVIEQYGYPVVSKEQSSYIDEYRNAKSEKLKKIRWEGGKIKGGFAISKKWRFLVNAPFKVSSKCCKYLKKNPFAKYHKQTGMVPFIGTMAEESSLRFQQLKLHGCNTYDAKKPTSKPMSYWTTSDVWEYIKKNNIPYSSIYDMGYKRTGCMFCMYGLTQEKQPDRFEMMKKTHPKQYAFCMDKLCLRDVINYVRNGKQTTIFDIDKV